ncbi:MAG: glycosyltransferase [Paludibacter sp.]|nr:glycosyltransferase [Paludibacter sp.]
MLKGENIICIANTSWFGNYAKSTVQIMERLALNNRVLFVEYPYTVKDILSTLRGKQNAPAARMVGFKKRLQLIDSSVGSKVYNLVTPPGIPVFFLKNEKLFRFFFGINVLIYKISLKKTIKKLKFDNPIIVTAYNPFYGLSLLNKLKEKAHIYYCYDGVESGFFGKRIFDYEDNFSKKVKTIITTSDFLNKQKLSINVNSHVVKNGVDFPVFEKFSKKEVFKRDRKKVGFIGSLDPRFDIETVETAVKALSDFDFEFTGDPRNQQLKARLSKYPNVKFFDPIKPNDVPELLATYDVGIIPYIVNEVNRNIYPLKINEYLAVGVPLVMTPFAILPEFEGLVTVSHSIDDFVEKLKIETQTDTPEKIKARIAFAASNSWEARTELFGNIIEKNI